MKNEPVAVLAYHHKDGTVEPLRFKLNYQEYRCDICLHTKESSWAGNSMIIFKYKQYELSFELRTAQWYIKYDEKQFKL